jgi:hypothetical protein
MGEADSSKFGWPGPTCTGGEADGGCAALSHPKQPAVVVVAAAKRPEVEVLGDFRKRSDRCAEGRLKSRILQVSAVAMFSRESL